MCSSAVFAACCPLPCHLLPCWVPVPLQPPCDEQASARSGRAHCMPCWRATAPRRQSRYQRSLLTPGSTVSARAFAMRGRTDVLRLQSPKHRCPCVVHSRQPLMQRLRSSYATAHLGYGARAVVRDSAARRRRQARPNDAGVRALTRAGKPAAFPHPIRVHVCYPARGRMHDVWLWLCASKRGCETLRVQGPAFRVAQQAAMNSRWQCGRLCSVVVRDARARGRRAPAEDARFKSSVLGRGRGPGTGHRGTQADVLA